MIQLYRIQRRYRKAGKNGSLALAAADGEIGGRWAKDRHNVTILGMDAPIYTKKIMYADPEHGGIRLTVLVTISVTYLAGFLLLRLLFANMPPDSVFYDFATILSCISALPIALGISYFVERSLKARWTSGQKLELGADQLCFEGADIADESIDALVIEWAKRVNLTRWYFTLAGYPKAGRERLVSDKWFCLACQLQQDDTRLIFFTYMPPNKAREWSDNKQLSEPFHQISLARLYRLTGKRRLGATMRPEIPTDMIAGQDSRYWVAERRRWSEGLELAAEDFSELMTYIELELTSRRIR